jgi:hypothetical protein
LNACQGVGAQFGVLDMDNDDDDDDDDDDDEDDVFL